jgi:hypothetical protein
MRIELVTVPEDLRSPHPTTCGICHMRFQTGPAVAQAIADSGTHFSEVCPKCLAGDEEGLVERLRRHAEWYWEMAEELEEAADEGIEDMPTPEELRLMGLLA